MAWYRLFYHFVWGTKGRLPSITEANQEPIYKAIQAKIAELNGIVHALNGMPDHVHLVASIPPTLALSAVMGQVKGVSSHLASRLPGGDPDFAWQNEYGVLSVSESHLPTIVNYVEHQQEHHNAQTLDSRLESVS